MTPIEQLYQKDIDQMTPKERVARSVAMFNWARDFMGRELRREHPDASIERLKLLVAMRMYGSDPKMRELLEKELEHVPA